MSEFLDGDFQLELKKSDECMHDLSKVISYENYRKLFQIIPYTITLKFGKYHWPATCTDP